MQSNSAGRNNALIERTHDFDGQSMIACWYGESIWITVVFLSTKISRYMAGEFR